jgi:hypothetical protein
MGVGACYPARMWPRLLSGLWIIGTACVVQGDYEANEEAPIVPPDIVASWQSLESESPWGPHRPKLIHGGEPLEVGIEGWSSELTEAPWIFNEFLPSWNVDVPEHVAFRVEVRAGSEDGEHLSPWLDLGGWGEWPAHDRAPTSCDLGQVDVDILRLDVVLDRVQLRLRTRGLAESEHVVLHHLSGIFSQWWSPRNERFDRPARHTDTVIEHIPQRRQTEATPELAPRICSPTSLAMALGYHGVDVPTEEVARVCYDLEHDLYGNWNRSIQGAWMLGVPGMLWRMNDWTEAELFLERELPLVISIGVEPGQLAGAPYESTPGHLLLLCGLEDGAALVLDPAVPPGEEGVRRYDMAGLEECWLRRGGFTYVLFPPR